MKPLLVCAGLGLAAWALTAANSDATVPYPAEYRNWVHVKSTLVGREHPRFDVNGGIHHFYANAKALEGYKTGKFADGSVLIDVLLEVEEDGGVTSEGARRRVAVMVKDAARYRGTGGWGFELFKGDGSAPALEASGKAACFACHGKQKDRDSVFSVFRK